MSWCEAGPSHPHLDPSRYELIPLFLKTPLPTILVLHPNLLFLLGSPSCRSLLFLQALSQTPQRPHGPADPNIIHGPKGSGSRFTLSPNPIPASYLASGVHLTQLVSLLKSHTPHPPVLPHGPHRMPLRLELTSSLFHSQTPSSPGIKSQSPQPHLQGPECLLPLQAPWLGFS